MQQAFAQLVEWTLQSAHHRSYLILMPWIHFLYGECKPFEKIPFDMSHDESEPKWWGIHSIENSLNSYKKNKRKEWDR